MKALLKEALREEGWELGEEVEEKLSTYGAEMLRWSHRINLTALKQPAQVVEKHFVDSLHLLPLLEGSCRLLDLGSGAGFPGAALAIAKPSLEVCLVEASAKKAAFLRHMAVFCGLHPRLQVRCLFARGEAEAEGLQGFEVVVSRALMEVEAFLPLAKNYVQPGGKVLAMLGKTEEAARPGLEALAKTHRCRLTEFRCFHLKPSGHQRALACFEVI